MESYSLKTVMSCSNDLVRFVCFCVVHKVSVYWHITFLKGSVGVREGGGWSARERFCSSYSLQSKLSAGSPSLASTHWHKSFIFLVSDVNLAWLLGRSLSVVTFCLQSTQGNSGIQATDAIIVIVHACGFWIFYMEICLLLRGVLHLHGG